MAKRHQAAARRGPRGLRGKTGRPGKRGVPADAHITDALREDLETMRAEAAVQMRRIAQLQAQLDVALAELHALSGERQPWSGVERRGRKPSLKSTRKSI